MVTPWSGHRGLAPSGNVSTGGVSTDNVSTDNVATDNVSTDNFSTDNVSHLEKTNSMNSAELNLFKDFPPKFPPNLDP